MSDPRTSARTAREGLAQGLQLLQTPGLPPDFLNAAEPIARAMGALMQIERGDASPVSVKQQADVALSSLRDALGRLQAIQSTHPAAEQAMGAVAGALGQVHGLSRVDQGQAAAAPQQQARPPQPPNTQYAAPAYQPPQQPAAPPATAYAPAPQQFQPPPQPQYQPPPQPQYQAPAAPQPQFAPPPAPQGFAPQAPAYQATQVAQPAPSQQQWQPPAPAAPPAPGGGFAAGSTVTPSMAPPGGPDSMRPPAGTLEAELGAHSPSNFYKTLSGNDIVEHGGIFVATYNVPKINSRINLRVHLPGGYHFDCAALVRWTREQRDNPDAPPGFGAQMQGVTAEQRQLIQRYVRNREPLFYDDL